MYIHVSIHTYIHTHTHPCMNTYIHTYVHPSIHTHTHTHPCMNTYIPSDVHPYIHTHTSMHAYIHPYIHPYMSVNNKDFLRVYCDITGLLLSNSSDKQRLLPHSSSNNVGSWSLAVPRYCDGRGSKSSNRVYFLFFVLLKVCFSNFASAIGNVLSFLCFGGFHYKEGM